MFLRKGALKKCSKFTEEHPYQSAISIKLQSNLIEIALRHGCSSTNLLRIFRRPFLKNTSGRLLLNSIEKVSLKKLEYSNDITFVTCVIKKLIFQRFGIEMTQQSVKLIFFKTLFITLQ